jgi:hypothetical protein
MVEIGSGARRVGALATDGAARVTVGAATGTFAAGVLDAGALATGALTGAAACASAATDGPGHCRP